MTIGLLVTAPIFIARRRNVIADVDRPALKNFVIASSLMAVAFIGHFEGLQLLPANVFYPLAQTQPLFAVAFSAFLLKNLEIVTWRTAVGAVYTVVGATFVVLG